MKQLSELNISPAPWKVVDSYQLPKYGGCVSVIESANGKTVSVPKYNDGSLIAAAPKMYEALRELYLTSLEPVGGTREERENQCKKYEEALDNARAALMEASRE